MADQGNVRAEPGMQPAAELLPAVYAELRAWPPRVAAGCRPARRSSRPPWSTRPTSAWWATGPRLEGPAPLLRRGGPGDAGDPHRAGPPQGQSQARRRGPARRADRGPGLIEPPADDLLALDEAIQKLQAEKPHLAEIVLLRYYTGLSVEETAAVLGESARTVYRDWRLRGPGWPADWARLPRGGDGPMT